MKKRLAFLPALAAAAAAIALLSLLPFPRHDVADLRPIETLTVSYEKGLVRLSGGDCLGLGNTVAEALEDLKRSSDGHVFLSTATQVILVGLGQELLPLLVKAEALRPAASVAAMARAPSDPAAAGRYLSTHRSGLTVQQVAAAMAQGTAVALPLLTETEGGYRLAGYVPG